MTTKKQKINEFLNFFRDIALQNKNYNLTKRSVYYELTALGVPQNQKRTEINQYFDKWIHHFANNQRCRVFVDKNWSYFCQFISTNALASQAKEHIKIYVPLDATHIERGAKEIFDFLSKHNIPHHSKIGTHVRFDDVVIRLINPDDMHILMDFLKNNEFIQEGLMPANPFAFSVEGIPMAVDGRLSYNSTIATLIALYINEKKNTNSLLTVNADDFYNFIQNYYNRAFANKHGLQKLLRDFEHELYEEIDYSKEILVNYKNIFELILKSQKDNFKFEDYINHYNECKNNNIQRQKINQIGDIIAGRNPQQIITTNKKELTPDSIQKIEERLLYVIDTMCEKYPDQYAVLINIDNYLITGQENYITRYKNLREQVINSTFREELNQLLQQNNINFIDYAESLLKKRKKMNNQNVHDTIETNVMLTIQEILTIMSAKYGEETAYQNLIKYIKTGMPHFLTRDENLRSRITNSTFRADCKEILAQRNIKLEDFIAIIKSEVASPKETILNAAILETYDKYEKKYQNGISRAPGLNFVTNSLKQLLTYGSYNGFTRDNDARTNLINNVSVEDALTIIKTALRINETQISYQDLTFIAKNYVEMVIENRRNKKR